METNLNCSIGIAPNKLLAKIASDLDKPDGLTIITEEDIEKRIWPLAAIKLWGVGPKTEAYLGLIDHCHIRPAPNADHCLKILYLRRFP